MEKKNTAVVTVVGNDTIGIIARVSAALAHHEANILDISQTVLSGMFNMIMIVDVSLSRFEELEREMERMDYELRAQGASLEAYANMMGGNMDAIKNSLRPGALNTVKTNVMLDAVVEAEIDFPVALANAGIDDT